MGQRAGERKAVSFGAIVSCSRFGMIRGVITDIGDGGLYVSAETSIVPIGSDVSVTFQPECALCEGAAITVRGRVSHQSLQGFGIVFEALEPHCRAALARLLPEMPLAPEFAYPALRAM